MRKGITLVEVLAAVVILTISVTTGFQLYTTNLATVASQQEYYYAENVLREVIEKIKNNPSTITSLNDEWSKVSGSSRLKNKSNYSYKTPKGQNINFDIYLDTAIFRVDPSTSPEARLTTLKTEVVWGKNQRNRLQASTLISGAYNRKPVDSN